jgi:hypothetical protein
MSQIITLARENTKEHQELIVEKLMSDKGVDVTILPSEGREVDPGPSLTTSTLIIGCKVDGCNKTIVSTKGATREEKFASLVANDWNHIKKSHPEQYEEYQGLIKGISEAIATLIWVDNCVKEGRSKQGKETMGLIREAQEQAEGIVDLYFEGTEVVELEEDGEEPEDDEGVIEGEVKES